MTRLALILWSAAALAAVAFAGLFWFTSGGPPTPAIGGPFRLKSQTGEMIDSAALKEHLDTAGVVSKARTASDGPPATSNSPAWTPKARPCARCAAATSP